MGLLGVILGIGQRDMTARTTSRVIVALSLTLAGCAGAGYAGQSTASGQVGAEDDWLIGQWQIESESGTGPSMVIVMDSVVEGTIHGHVLRFMSGNVGLGPRDFRPFATSPTPEGFIAVTVEMSDPASPPIRVVFQRVVDRLEVRALELGNEDMLARGRRWVARRVD